MYIGVICLLLNIYWFYVSLLFNAYWRYLSLVEYILVLCVSVV